MNTEPEFYDIFCKWDAVTETATYLVLEYGANPSDNSWSFVAQMEGLENAKQWATNDFEACMKTAAPGWNWQLSLKVP